MISIRDLGNLNGKKVIVRTDFNIPVENSGDSNNMNQNWRIKSSLPTINYLRKNGAVIILASHLGSPNGKIVENLRLGFVKNILKKFLMTNNVEKVDDCIGDDVKKIINKTKSGGIILLENLRFYKEEKKNSDEFAKELASLANIYINDAFSVSHRAHASVCAITKFLPSYSGFLLEREVKKLSAAVNSAKKPVAILLGGAKVKTKLPLINRIIKKCDYLMLGGVIANVLFKTKGIGIDIKKSLMSKDLMEKAKEIDLSNKNLMLPSDCIVYNSEKAKTITISTKDIRGEKVFDIGEKTLKIYSKIIYDSKTVIWNGPMGLFEKDDFCLGTKKIAKAISESDGYTIAGGGDTIVALGKFGYFNKINYVSTGGGAMLEFLSGKKLPGLDALEFY